jgi:HEAT repeat protein
MEVEWMQANFAVLLTIGGKSNSLGRVNEIIQLVLQDATRLDELYSCLFNEDAWVRMRAADALEKICREHPDWLLPYVDRLSEEVAVLDQPSIQWHLAQIYRQVNLTNEQKSIAIQWLKQRLLSPTVDWIVAANVIDTLAYFTQQGSVPPSEFIPLLQIQQHHKSKAVVKRAARLLQAMSV